MPRTRPRSSQSWPLPANPRPIVTFGAGSIVGDAHFPAYRKAGFPVAGLYDPDHAKAQKLAAEWGVKAFGSAEEAASVKDAIFDLATPPAAPCRRAAGTARRRGRADPEADGQRPRRGDARSSTICREKKLTAAVNFQLRFAPMMLALKDAIAKGWLGEVVDFDACWRWRRPGSLGLPSRAAAHRDRHAFDPLSRPDPAVAGRSARRACQDDRPSRTTTWRRRAPAPSSTMATACAARCRSTTTTSSAASTRPASSASAAPRARPICKLGLNLDYPRGEPDDAGDLSEGR